MVHHERWYSAWAPGLAQARRSARSGPRSARETWDELIAKMNAALQLPGWTNAWTMPIKTRVDMLTTGVRTPVGHQGLRARPRGDRARRRRSSRRSLAQRAGTRSVLYERSLGGTYVDVVPDRDALARYGLQVGDLNDVIETRDRRRAGHDDGRGPRALHGQRPLQGGLPRARPRSCARCSSRCRRAAGARRPAQPIPLGELADVKVVEGPPMLRDEAGLLVGYVYVDLEPSRDIGGYVDDAKAAVDGARRRAASCASRPGMYLQVDRAVRAARADARAHEDPRSRSRCSSIAVLLYLQFRHLTEVLIVFLSIPFALVGSVWLLYLLDYRISTAVLGRHHRARRARRADRRRDDRLHRPRVRPAPARREDPRPRTTSSTRTPRARCSACARS